MPAWRAATRSLSHSTVLLWRASRACLPRRAFRTEPSIPALSAAAGWGCAHFCSGHHCAVVHFAVQDITVQCPGAACARDDGDTRHVCCNCPTRCHPCCRGLAGSCRVLGAPHCHQKKLISSAFCYFLSVSCQHEGANLMFWFRAGASGSSTCSNADAYRHPSRALAFGTDPGERTHCAEGLGWSVWLLH